MLRQKIKLNLSSENEAVEINDFFISQDLSYISGTTNPNHNITVNDSLYVDSDYVPNKQKVRVSGATLVRDYGYIQVGKKVIIQHAYYANKAYTGTSNRNVPYIELNGVIYYPSTNKVFTIYGEDYSFDDTTKEITIHERIPVYNANAVIDGTNYQVVFTDSDNKVLLFNEEGVAYNDSSIVTSGLTKNFTYKTLLTLSNTQDKTLSVENAYLAGYKPYVRYKGNIYYFDEIYSNGRLIGYGPTINGVSINSSDYFNEKTSTWETNKYSNRIEFGTIVVDNCTILPIEFEFMKLGNASTIAMQMSDDSAALMIGDPVNTIAFRSQFHYDVQTDETGNEYIVYENARIGLLNGLCDTLTIGGIDYPISYSGDCSEPFNGMYCTVNVGYFTINYQVVDVDTEKKLVKKIQRLAGVNFTSKTVITSGGTKVYVDSSPVSVNNIPGVLINEVKCPKQTITVTDYIDESGNTVSHSESFVSIEESHEYKLQTLDLIGSRTYLFDAKIREVDFDYNEVESIKNSIVRSIANHNESYSFYKPSILFGYEKLIAGYGLDSQIDSSKSLSTIDISQVKKKLSFFKNTGYYSIPVGLSKTEALNLNTEDKASLFFTDEQINKSINSIVDMEKNMYIPIINKNGEEIQVDNIKFNLHFRTRDLNSWKIIEDEGEKSENKDFCNWFVTDYWPYNNNGVYNNHNLTERIKMSDLLGFLYFTDSDIYAARKKFTKSFLRLSFYDSYNSETQSLLGTSTLFFDSDNAKERYFANKPSGMKFYEAYKSLSGNVTTANTTNAKYTDISTVDHVTVFAENTTEGSINDTNSDYRIDSSFTVTDSYRTNHSSEGYYLYILKTFGKDKISHPIYMKAEFFHAGLGIKIPMVLPTNDTAGTAISNWSEEELEEFKKGYSLAGIQRRLYVKLNCEYSEKYQKYIYTPSEESINAILEGNDLVYNLFELKTRHPDYK